MWRLTRFLHRPSWFAPVRGFWEWVGFVGGILVLSGLVFIVVVAATSNHVTQRVHNDTGMFVTVSLCVDDAAEVEPGEDFNAEGVPERNQLVCLVTPSRGPSRCVAVPAPSEKDITASLSHLHAVGASACE
jgi:hypothetical protein